MHPAAKTPGSFLPLLRELARAYQAFEAYSAQHIRELGLTAPQFDIIATLGNTSGMTFKALGEKTLTTKGTLTGIIDRLEQKKLVQRESCEQDRRIVYAKLTPSGQRLFEQVFPAHLEHLGKKLQGLNEQQITGYATTLKQIGDLFRD